MSLGFGRAGILDDRPALFSKRVCQASARVRATPGKLFRHLFQRTSGLLDQFQGLGLGHPAEPAGQKLFLGPFPVLLQFEQAQNQIAQRGHDKGSGFSGDQRRIFSQGDIPAVVRSVFASRPMSTDELI